MVTVPYSETYELGNSSTDISFGVVENLPVLSLDLVSIPQHLASFDVQGAEYIDSIESYERLHLREGVSGSSSTFLGVMAACRGK